MQDAKDFCDLAASIYHGEYPVPLHRPFFSDLERSNLVECIDSNYVSSIGPFVSKFEEMISQYVGARFVVATASGTAALHLSLLACGVGRGTEVITQPLSFVATANAIAYTGAKPIFLDIGSDNLSLCPAALSDFFERNTEITKKGACRNKNSGDIIKACVPMHTFGHPAKIVEIVEICRKYGVRVVEDSAESFGSTYGNKHTGTFGDAGIFSFNGNKIITTGGGGAIVTNNEQIAKITRHLSTTAKLANSSDFFHDQIGYNYRMPNVNASIGCAQLCQIDFFIAKKQSLAGRYKKFFSKRSQKFFVSLNDVKQNHWLNTVEFTSEEERNLFLDYTNKKGIMTRPSWVLLNELPMYSKCETDELRQARSLSARLCSIPSSVPFEK